ncbi:MAG: sugar phosphate isomerase/epimerase, partial [Caldilineaceae bacterium]|nr:sugar phosphate isomerase/epimerase [Caldilineaceae bacterium]
QELRNYIDAAAQLGVSFLRVTAGQNHPGVKRQDGVSWAAEGLTAWVEEAAAAGVTLTYENHAIGYVWTYFDFSQTASVFLEICDRTADSGLQLLFDTANLLAVDDDPLTVLDAVLPRVAAIHVSDIRQKGSFEPVLIGSGVTPLNAIFERFRKAGFHGWISVEEASKTGEEGFRQAIPKAKELWQN